MRTKLLFILVMLGIMTIGCSRKAVPAIPSGKTPCDSLIQSLIDSIEDVEPVFITETIYKDGEPIIDTICITDSSNCNYYKITALEIAAKYNSAIKERDFYKAMANSQAKKIINNNYVNSKNKNTQIGDANVQQIKPKATAVVGDGNVITVKPKQSAIGDGNKLDNSKKGVGWFWIFIAGNLCWLIIQNLLYPILMRFIPFANLTSNIGKGLLKLKFW